MAVALLDYARVHMCFRVHCNQEPETRQWSVRQTTEVRSTGISYLLYLSSCRSLALSLLLILPPPGLSPLLPLSISLSLPLSLPLPRCLESVLEPVAGTAGAH